MNSALLPRVETFVNGVKIQSTAGVERRESTAAQAFHFSARRVRRQGSRRLFVPQKSFLTSEPQVAPPQSILRAVPSSS